MNSLLNSFFSCTHILVHMKPSRANFRDLQYSFFIDLSVAAFNTMRYIRWLSCYYMIFLWRTTVLFDKAKTAFGLQKRFSAFFISEKMGVL